MLSLQIILVFVVMMFSSYIPDLFPKFFGDYQCIAKHYTEMGICYGDHYHWGWRHILFLCMGIALFFVQVIRIISFCDKHS